MLDSNRYRREVLKALLDDGRAPLDDPFVLFAIDAEATDAAAIRLQVDVVVALWRKEQASPRYKNLVTSLLKDREALSLEVIDPKKRAMHRDRVLSERSASAEARFAQLDEMLATLDRRWGGIPRSRVERLRSAATRAGVSDDEFRVRVQGHNILDDSNVAADAPAPTIRLQARNLLSEYSSLCEDTPRRTYRTLFEFVGVEPDGSVSSIESARERVSAKNRQRRHDRLRTVVDELLALVSDLLLSAPAGSYVAGLSEDAADEIRPVIETALLLEDRLTAVEFERLLRISVAGGLDPDAARRTIIQVARQLGAAVEMGTAVDYVVCASCRNANATTGNATSGDDRLCGRCGADLFRTCPGCQRLVAQSSAICSSCRYDLAALRDAESEIEFARVSLADGFLADARWRAESLLRSSAQLPEVQRLVQDVENRHRSVMEMWAELPRLAQEGRFDDALSMSATIGSIARDVPGPEGGSLDAFRVDIETRIADIRGRLVAANALSPDSHERAVLALAEQYPTSADVLAVLRSLPLAGPSRIVSLVTSDGVRVSWKASPSAGPVQYRVVRRLLTGDGTTSESRPLGSTSATSIEDAGVAPGSVVSYEVQAVRFGIQSGRVSTRNQLIAFEVARLAAVEHDGAIELRWTRHSGHEEIWVERTDITDPSVARHRIRAGAAGWIDTSVIADHHYSYRIFVEYRSHEQRGTTTGRTITATAFVEPEAPVLTIEGGASLRLRVPGAGETKTLVIRCDADPALRSGSVVDHRRLSSMGRELEAEADGAFLDRIDGRVAWYVPAARFGTQCVIGSALLHPGIEDVVAVNAAADGNDLVVRWTWPEGCTEAMVVWRFGEDPASLTDDRAIAAKVTNMAYELSGGYRVRDLPEGIVGVLVRPARRVGGQLVPVPGCPETARARHLWEHIHRISYTVRLFGRRKRELRVEITRDVLARPAITVIAHTPEGPSRSGASTAGSGRVLGTIEAGASSIVVSLDGVERPTLVGLVLQAGDVRRLRIEDPSPQDRTIS